MRSSFSWKYIKRKKISKCKKYIFNGYIFLTTNLLLGFFSYLTMFLKDQHWDQEESKLPILKIMNLSCHLSWLYSPFIEIQGVSGGLGLNPGLATYLCDFSYINYLFWTSFSSPIKRWLVTQTLLYWLSVASIMLHNKFSVANNNKHLFSSWVCGVQLIQAEFNQN